MSQRARIVDAMAYAHGKSFFLPVGFTGPSADQVAKADAALIAEIRTVLKEPPPADLTSVPLGLEQSLSWLIRQVGGPVRHTSWRRIGFDGTELSVTGKFARKQSALEMQEVINAMREVLAIQFAGTRIVSYHVSEAVRSRMAYDAATQTLTLKGKFTALLNEDEDGDDENEKDEEDEENSSPVSED